MPVALKIYQRETIELQLEPREERGKGPVGRLRRQQGRLPGIVYGHKQEPLPFKIEARQLERALAGGGQNAIFVLRGAGNGNSQRAVVRDIQYHKVLGSVVHVDFLRIDPDEQLTVAVPLTTAGTPAGVRVGGGAVQHSLNTIVMTCVASELPSRVEVDITDLEIGDSIHVSDLLQQESRIATDPEVTIVSVLAPRLTIDEELQAAAEAAEAAEVPAEGEVAGEGGAERTEGTGEKT